MKIKDYYPLIIYFISLIVVGNFAFTTDYTTVSDTAREYELYQQTITNGASKLPSSDEATGAFILQSTSLSTTYLPAVFQKLTGIESKLFFKLWALLFLPFFPVVVYYLTKRYMTNISAFLVSVLMISQVVWFHSPAMARFSFAMLFIGLALLVIQSQMEAKHRYPLLIFLAIMAVVSHYSAVFIIIGMIASMYIVVSLIRFFSKVKFQYANKLMVYCSFLVLFSWLWYSVISGAPMRNYIGFATQAITATAEIVGVGTNGQGEVEIGVTSPSGIAEKDKILQAAFGVRNPDGDKEFQFSYAALIFSWLVIITILIGCLAVTIGILRGRIIIDENYILAAVGGGLLVLMVIVPFLSRGYGIERLFFQVLLFLNVYFIYGSEWLARVLQKMRLNIPAPVIATTLLVPYFYLTATVGIIHSITGVN